MAGYCLRGSATPSWTARRSTGLPKRCRWSKPPTRRNGHRKKPGPAPRRPATPPRNEHADTFEHSRRRGPLHQRRERLLRVRRGGGRGRRLARQDFARGRVQGHGLQVLHRQVGQQVFGAVFGTELGWHPAVQVPRGCMLHDMHPVAVARAAAGLDMGVAMQIKGEGVAEAGAVYALPMSEGVPSSCRTLAAIRSAAATTSSALATASSALAMASSAFLMSGKLAALPAALRLASRGLGTAQP